MMIFGKLQLNAAIMNLPNQAKLCLSKELLPSDPLSLKQFSPGKQSLEKG